MLIVKRLFVSIPVYLLWSLLAIAQYPPVWDIPYQQVLSERGEVYFSFAYPGSDTLEVFANIISVDRVVEQRVYAYANQSEFERFLFFQMPFLVHVPPGMLLAEKNIEMRDSVNIQSIESWNFYPTYEAYASMMTQFAERFSGLCELVSIKTLDSGRELLFAVIGRDDESGLDQKPRFMYTSTMHGDETVGFNLLLRLIHTLLYGYGEDEQITSLINNLEIWICPNENPDGTYTSDNSTVIGAIRGNINNIDLNRNYPFLIGTNSQQMQKETSAMIRLADSLQFVSSANIHSGIELVNHPWDFWRSAQNRHADHDWWNFVSREYADTARYYSPSGYMNPSSFSCSSCIRGVTHGGDWYVVYGSRQDYMNYFARQRELTLELSNTKLLPTSLLDDYWEFNRRSLLNYMKQALYGIQGVVFDSHQGEAIRARISLSGHDKDNSEVYSSFASGRFSRPLLAGSYDLLVEAESYPLFSFDGLQANNYEALLLKVDMGRPTLDATRLVFDPAVAGGMTFASLLLYNPGNEILQISIGDIVGDEEAFGIGFPVKSAIDIPPREDRSVPLWFAPPGYGEYRATLLLHPDVEGQPSIMIPLVAYAPQEASLIGFVNPDLDFAKVEVGQTKTMELTILNSGNIEMQIGEVAISGSGFSVNAEFPQTLAPGGAVDIPVVFHPEQISTYSATLRFETNAWNNEDQPVRLVGDGIESSVGVAEYLPKALLPYLFPNPVSKHSKVVLTEVFHTPLIMQVVDLHGRLIFQKEHGPDAIRHGEIHLGSHLEGLTPGVYLCRLIYNDRVVGIRFVK